MGAMVEFEERSNVIWCMICQVKTNLHLDRRDFIRKKKEHNKGKENIELGGEKAKGLGEGNFPFLPCKQLLCCFQLLHHCMLCVHPLHTTYPLSPNWPRHIFYPDWS